MEGECGEDGLDFDHTGNR